MTRGVHVQQQDTCHAPRHPHITSSAAAGARISAAEAAKIGLISRTVPAEQLMDEARKVGLVVTHAGT